MKRWLAGAGIVLVTATLAFADWLTDFRDVYFDKGIDQAVVEALKQGATPDGIMENGLLLDGLNPQNLVKAMYCAGIRGEDIRAAGQRWDVTELLIVAGYKKSVEECGDVVADTQAYTPVATTVSFLGPTFPGGGVTASVSSF